LSFNKHDIQPQFSPVTAVSSNQWNTGICGCFDDCNVCEFEVPSLAFHALVYFGEYCCLPLIDLCACIPPVSMALRASVRNRYGIQPGVKVTNYTCLCCYWQLVSSFKLLTTANKPECLRSFQDRSSTSCLFCVLIRGFCSLFAFWTV
uniref:PLAC8 like 1 n=1 Tax=Sinocyclocheilus rhinocerous TaxID=307959 RepID=A0A673LVH8_9TELE